MPVPGAVMIDLTDNNRVRFGLRVGLFDKSEKLHQVTQVVPQRVRGRVLFHAQESCVPVEKRVNA